MLYFCLQCLTSKGIPFYINTISSIVQRCISNPRISEIVQRFPVVPVGSYRFGVVCKLPPVVPIKVSCIFCREMFHASRWLNDARFYSPMACLLNGTHAFIRDCASCRHPALGVVTCIIVMYFMKVRLWTNDLTYQLFNLYICPY